MFLKNNGRHFPVLRGQDEDSDEANSIAAGHKDPLRLPSRRFPVTATATGYRDLFGRGAVVAAVVTR